MNNQPDNKPKTKNGLSLAWSTLWWSCAINTLMAAVACAGFTAFFLFRREAYQREPNWWWVLWVALAGGIVTLLFTLREDWPRPHQMFRRTRACRKCGYGLRGQRADTPGCPECGWRRED